MRYAIVSTVAFDTTDESGNPLTVKAGTVLNVVIWDGKSAYNPGDNLRLVQSDTLQIGDIAG